VLYLTKQEKIILLFLVFSFATGLAISIYRKTEQKLDLKVVPFEIKAAPEELNEFIGQNKFININSPKVEELKRLPGVGKELASKIVEYHKIHGAFGAKEELMRVKGIGEKKFKKLKNLIVLE